MVRNCSCAPGTKDPRAPLFRGETSKHDDTRHVTHDTSKTDVVRRQNQRDSDQTSDILDNREVRTTHHTLSFGYRGWLVGYLKATSTIVVYIAKRSLSPSLLTRGTHPLQEYSRRGLCRYIPPVSPQLLHFLCAKPPCRKEMNEGHDNMVFSRDM